MDNTNEITIIYKLESWEQELRILGDKFIENNKNNCKLLINGKKGSLKTWVKREDIQNRNICEIKLIGINSIINTSEMFSFCISLTNLPDISK